MKAFAVYLAGALLLLAADVAAQTPERKDRPAADCERFTGAAREQCLLQKRGLAGSCDALIGPDKEICLSKGGTVEAGLPGGGASRPPPAKK